jgi:large subunit ribosomal protein L5
MPRALRSEYASSSVFAVVTNVMFIPEIYYDDIKKINGMNITFVTTAKTDDEAYSLLKALGMPLQEK